MIHTNGMALLRAMLKGDHIAHMSAKQPGRYSNESAGGHNVCPTGTEYQMGALVLGGLGKRHLLAEPIGPKAMRQPEMLYAWNA